MSHLPTERLAALVDDAPTGPELAHLASCAECARERAAFRNLSELAAAESSRLGTPLTTCAASMLTTPLSWAGEQPVPGTGLSATVVPSPGS